MAWPTEADITMEPETEGGPPEILRKQTWVWQNKHVGPENTLDASEIRHLPVEVGSLSPYVQGFIYVG